MIRRHVDPVEDARVHHPMPLFDRSTAAASGLGCAGECPATGAAADSPLASSPGVRATDPATSRSGMDAVRPVLRALQLSVLRAFADHGAMHAMACESLPAFSGYGFSTVRKRVSECAQAGLLEACGVERVGRSSLTTYRLSDSGASALAAAEVRTHADAEGA